MSASVAAAIGDRAQVHRRRAGSQLLASGARLLGRLGVDVVDDHLRSLAHEGQRAGAADAHGPSR